MGYLSELRVEPAVFLFMIAYHYYGVASNSLVLQKTCFPDAPPGVAAICNDEEKMKTAASYNMVRGTLREVLPALTVLLAGSWRDHSGLSRPLLVLAHLGELVTLLTGLAAVYFWELSPWISVLGDSLPTGLAGSKALVTMTATAYVTERSSLQDRTHRLAGVITAILGGASIASLSGGYVLEVMNYSGLFFFLIGIYIFNLVLLFVLVRGETRRKSGRAFDSLRNLRVVFRRRPNNAIIWAFIIFDCLIAAILTCEGTNQYIFLHKHLKMTPKDAGFFSGYRLLVSLLTAAILTPLLKKMFHLSDLTVAFICTIPSIFSGIGMAFVNTTLQAYIFVTLDLMRIVLISTLLSLITRSLKKTEVGTYMSFMFAGESVLPVALNPLYTYIFKRTLDTLPGAFHLISAGVASLGACIILVACCFYKEVEEDEANLEESSAE